MELSQTANNLLIAIISGVFTVIVAIITIYHRDIFAVFQRRRRTVRGAWKGMGIEQLLDSESQKIENEYEITLELHQLGSRVTGLGRGRDVSGIVYEANLKGRMEDEHFITLFARSISAQEFDIAVMMLELDARGRSLSGFSLANGLAQHGITFSRIVLNKEPL